jgi:hypothetical protein
MKYGARQANPPQIPCDTWVLVLNRYQRDNLLQLFNVIGFNTLPFPQSTNATAIEPFNLLLNGDWAGEIPWMLAKQHPDHPALGSATIDEDDAPNDSLDTIRGKVEQWKQSLISSGGSSNAGSDLKTCTDDSLY